MPTPKHLRHFNIPWEVRPYYGIWHHEHHEPSTRGSSKMKPNSSKFNGYIFKRDQEDGTTLFVPKKCECTPLHPETYGLPGTHGRRGTKYEKMIFMRGDKQVARGTGDLNHSLITDAMVEDPEVAARQAYDEEKPNQERKKSPRLSKWEASPRQTIEEGRRLAEDDSLKLHSDGWRADLWEAQIAALARQGLLEDYGTDEQDLGHLQLKMLHRDKPTYTIKLAPTNSRGRKRQL